MWVSMQRLRSGVNLRRPREADASHVSRPFKAAFSRLTRSFYCEYFKLADG
jgi:hypothetical protein